jgi:hypothetical protein
MSPGAQSRNDTPGGGPTSRQTASQRSAAGAETSGRAGRHVFEAPDTVLSLDDAKAAAPTADIGRVSCAMREAARGGMIVPCPSGRHVDFQSHTAAETLTGSRQEFFRRGFHSLVQAGQILGRL